MKRAVIIVAGGSGNRLGSTVPKQYLELEGKPVILHTIERFFLFEPQIDMIVVIARDHQALWEELGHKHNLPGKARIAYGGRTRFTSVRNGLELLEYEGVVGIHDAARPLVSMETLKGAYASAENKGSGIPLVEVAESVRQERNRYFEPVNRKSLRLVQTPQAFQISKIKNAFEWAEGEGFTDDASVYEKAYGLLDFVKGNKENIKITTVEDLRLAAALVNQA